MRFLGIAFLLAATAFAWGADAKDDAPVPIDEEIVEGVVLDAATNKPLDGATIAIRTRKGAVINWGKSGTAGEFRIGGSYVANVRLPAYKARDRSLLGQIARGANSVFSVAARSAGSLVKPVVRAAGSAVGGPVVGEVAGAVAGAVAPVPEPWTLDLPDPDDPGVFTLKVVCPGYVDYQGPVQAYWMDPPDESAAKRILRFWLDPVALAPRGDGVKVHSGPRAVRMRLREAALDPSIAPRGSEVTVSVRLEVPAVADGCVKVLAWHDKTGSTQSLEPVEGKPGLFRGRVRVGEEWPLNDQRIVVLALRCSPASPQGPRTATPEELADKLSLWKSRKLAFDPQILASRDREALTLTVVPAAPEGALAPEPKRAAPVAAPAPKRAAPRATRSTSCSRSWWPIGASAA